MGGESIVNRAGKIVTGRAGFTLVEVALAVLVVGLGLLAIFGLFPSGLRSAEDATADTRSGLFAETLLNGMRGRAMSVTNWDDWCDRAWMSDELRRNVLAGAGTVTTGVVSEVVFPQGGADWLRYRLTIDLSNSNRYWAVLEVEDGRYPSGMLTYPSGFYTEFPYLGQ